MPERLDGPDWSSLRQLYERCRHAARAVEGGLQARNPGQQWLVRFDGRGFSARPDTGRWQWGLELRSYGFVGHQRAVADQPRVSAEGQRVTYDWDAMLQEWFVNDRRGLEHGFTVRHRPIHSPAAARDGACLAFTLAVRGELRPEVESGGRGVRFVDTHGAAAVTYTGLAVWDADGRALASRFEPAAEGLRLEIEESDARYPLTIDPIARQAYLKASNTDAGDQFGSWVAVSGDTVVVGAPGEDSGATEVGGDQTDDSASAAGAAYVFVRDGTGWSQQAYLKARNAGANDGFGACVAVSGGTAVVGAFVEDGGATSVDGDQDDNSAAYAGAAYVLAGLEIGPCLVLQPSVDDSYCISFEGIPGRIYQFQRATSVEGPWNTIDTRIAPASGLMKLCDTAPPAVHAYYRVLRP